MKNFLLFLALLGAYLSYGQAENWNNILKEHVSAEGRVNYETVYKDINKLEAYIAYLSKHVPKNKASKEVKLAYWINVYNANTVYMMSKKVVEEYAVSIYLINDAFDNKFIKAGKKNYSLNQIEKEMLKKTDLKDPRIHFALVCASESCPKLLNEEYTPEKLSNQLDTQAYSFINDAHKNKINSGKVELSAIFDWYKSDFENANCSLICFINKYSDVKIDENVEIEFSRYDWLLNN